MKNEIILIYDGLHDCFYFLSNHSMLFKDL